MRRHIKKKFEVEIRRHYKEREKKVFVYATEGILYEASEGVYRATATKPKTARAAKVLTPLETAPLVAEGAALELEKEFVRRVNGKMYRDSRSTGGGR